MQPVVFDWPEALIPHLTDLQTFLLHLKFALSLLETLIVEGQVSGEVLREEWIDLL